MGEAKKEGNLNEVIEWQLFGYGGRRGEVKMCRQGPVLEGVFLKEQGDIQGSRVMSDS